MSKYLKRYTTYRATIQINKWFNVLGIDKQLPGPMVFNYTTAKLKENKKPMIPSYRENDGEKDVTYIEFEELVKWFALKYIPKNFPSADLSKIDFEIKI